MGLNLRGETQEPFSEPWDAAYGRVDSYLESMGITHRPTRSNQVKRILEMTRRHCESGDTRAPESIAGEVLMQLYCNWFREQLESNPEEAEGDLFRRGRLALFSCHLSPERQQQILGNTLDEDFQNALRHAFQWTGPAFGRTALQPRPLDYGPLPKAAESTLESLDRYPQIKFTLLWLAAFLVFGGLFYFTR